MKVLSIQQPWASLVMCGVKRWELRSWPTGHRGPLAIHAGRRFRLPQRQLCMTPPLGGLLAAVGLRRLRDLPLGYLLGVVNVVDCVPASDVAELLDPRLGALRPSDFAWLLANPVRLPVPIAYVGQLGLCDLPREIAAMLGPARLAGPTSSPPGGALPPTSP